jgi:glycosyltransferase involved in cell wall biosynthesis
VSDLPNITFGIIVLNGEPYTRYCLRALYPFAHEIIVVEGACQAAAAIATPDGHSTDGTLEILHRLKAEEDPENKLTIVTAEMHGYPNGFWSREKDEQSQAYAERATGDYLWQIDIDEFYHPEDMRTLLKILANDPSTSGVSFYWQNFWGGFDYLVDGWEYRDLVRRMNGIRRLFRWGNGYRYASHRPPTVVDDQNQDLCTLNWIGPQETGRMGIFCYHYGMVFPRQARQKTLYYQKMWKNCENMDVWYRDSYLELRHPFRVLHGTKPPSWLEQFKGNHPTEIQKMIKDCQQGSIKMEQRSTNDIDRLLSSYRYKASVSLLHYLYYFIMLMKQGSDMHQLSRFIFPRRAK